VGRQVRELRLRADLTQVELARLANVDQATISRLESGRGGTLSTLIDLLRALDRERWLEELAPVPTVSPIQMARERKAAQARRRTRARGQRGETR
jgi:transcriptional regulator with XRE-family HTH domain